LLELWGDSPAAHFDALHALALVEGVDQRHQGFPHQPRLLRPRKRPWDAEPRYADLRTRIRADQTKTGMKGRDSIHPVFYHLFLSDPRRSASAGPRTKSASHSSLPSPG